MLPAWRPVPSYASTMTIFIVFGIVFLTLGVALYVMSEKIQQVELQYDMECTTAVCELPLVIKEKIEGPVYVYYELGNFYQNHRRYVKSRSYKQLMGEDIEMTVAEADCDPIIKNQDIDKVFAADGVTKLDPEAIAIPCGLIAKSFFNDTYSLSQVENFATTLDIDSSDIAWKSDVDFKFKNQDREDWDTVQWHDITDRKYNSISILTVEANFL